MHTPKDSQCQHSPALGAYVVVEGSCCDDHLWWLPCHCCGPGGSLPPARRLAKAQVAALQAQQVTSTHPRICKGSLNSLQRASTTKSGRGREGMETEGHMSLKSSKAVAATWQKQESLSGLTIGDRLKVACCAFTVACRSNKSRILL
jgi:hypothetical protein